MIHLRYLAARPHALNIALEIIVRRGDSANLTTLSLVLLKTSALRDLQRM
jgi:hypothetical protein